MTEGKTNYKNKYKDYNCVACEKNNTFVEETQEHIYVCKNIKENNEDFLKIFENKQETKCMNDITNKYLANKKERKKMLEK